jgi:hypothetical protein
MNVSRESGPTQVKQVQEGSSGSVATKGTAHQQQERPVDPDLAALRRSNVQSPSYAPKSRPPRGLTRVDTKEQFVEPTIEDRPSLGTDTVSTATPALVAGSKPSTDAAPSAEASAAQTATLAKAASEIEWHFHVPMDEATKAVALDHPEGVGIVVEGMSSPAQRALLEAARGFDPAKAASGASHSLGAKQSARQLEKSLDKRIASLKEVFKLGRPNEAEQKISDWSHQMTSLMSDLVKELERAGGERQGISRALRETQLYFAGHIQASPKEQIDAARNQLDKQCELLTEDAKQLNGLTANDQRRLACKWKQALSLASDARLDVLGASLNSSPATNYLDLITHIQGFRTIEDDEIRKKVLADAQNARRNWPEYAEEVHRDAWSSWADMDGAFALSKLAERTPDAKQRIPALVSLVSKQLGSILTRFELKPPPSSNLKAQESFEKLDEMLRNLVDMPDIHQWQDAFSGESAEVVNEASKFAATAISSLQGFAPKLAAAYLKPMQRIELTRRLEISLSKLNADETTFYASVMARVAHMAQALKGELKTIDARVANDGTTDQSQDSKGKGKQTSEESSELRLQLQTLMQPMDVIESTAREFVSLLVADVTEEDFVKLIRFGQAPDIDAPSVADTDDIADVRATPSVREPLPGAASLGGATEAEAPQASTLSDHLKGLRPPNLGDVVPERDVDPITFQQMKAVVDPFLKSADESWSKALVTLNNYSLASFDRKKRQQLLGCSNELKQAVDALVQARAAYSKELAEANKRSGVQRKFSLLEDNITKSIGLYKKAIRWVKNWADGLESLSFTERVKQGHLKPRFGKDSSDEGFCFHTSHGWTVEALASQPPITRWDGVKENRDDVAFHFHFHNDPTSIPMSEVTKDMLAVMTVKQQGDRFITHREDQDGRMQHVPEVVVPQNEAWEVFKRVVQSDKSA